MLFVSYYLPHPIMLSIYLLYSTFLMSPLLSVPSISLLIAQFSSMSHLCQPSKLLSLSIQVLNGVSYHFGGIHDLVFSNNCSVLVENSEVVSVPCDPYHPALVIKFPFGQDHPLLDKSHKYFNFQRTCYPDICSFLLSFNWLETIVSLDVDQATNAFYDALHFCDLNFVPEVSYSPSNFPLCYNSFIAQTECKLKTNPPSFWDFVWKSKSSDGIPYTVHFDKKIGSGPESVSSLFSSSFSTVYATPSSSHTPVISFSHFNLPSNFSFTTYDVELSLSTLKTSKSAGPDSLPGTFLYNIRSALYIPLWLIFRCSLDTGTFPSIALDLPTLGCISCHKLCFKKNLIKLKNMKSPILHEYWSNLIEFVQENNLLNLFVCKNCLKIFRSAKMPAQCILNDFCDTIQDEIHNMEVEYLECEGNDSHTEVENVLLIENSKDDYVSINKEHENGTSEEARQAANPLQGINSPKLQAMLSSSAQRGAEQNLETALANLKSIIKQQYKALNVLLTNVEHLKTTKDKTKSPTVMKAMDEVIGSSEALKTVTSSVHSAVYETEKVAIRAKNTDQHTMSRTIQETILKVCEDLKDRLDKQQEDIKDLKNSQAAPASSYSSKARVQKKIPSIVANPMAGQPTAELRNI
ncbi:hypothetical protein ACI65C_013639 [Semiaphis heraclei]